MKCCLLLYLLPVEGILEWPVTSRVPSLFLYVFSLSRALLKPPCTLFIAPVSMLVVEFWHANCTVVSVSWVTEMLCSCTPASHQLRDRKTNTSADTQEKLKLFFFSSMWCCSYSCTSVITFVKRPVLWCDAAPAGGLNNSSQSRKSILVCQQLSEALKRVRIKNSARSFLNWQGRPTNCISGSHTVKYLVILFYIYTNCNSAVCYCY